MTSFFLYCIKKMSFSGSPKGTPHDWCRRTMKKNYPEPKKCSICWVSHMFSIWEYRYSYGICFGTVYALQNSTPNISTPNILSIFFLSTPVGLKSGIFYVSHRDYKYKKCKISQRHLTYTYIYYVYSSYLQDKLSIFPGLLQEVISEALEQRLLRSIKGVDRAGSTHRRDASLLTLGTRRAGLIPLIIQSEAKWLNMN